LWFKTGRVHDRRTYRVHDLPTRGRPTTLVWIRRRFACSNCEERHWEDHPQIILGRRTHVTRRLARQLVRDVGAMSIREVSRRSGLSWHYIMGLTRSWSDRVAAERRRRRCRVLLVDETSLRRGHRYVTVLINGDTGETLGIVRYRSAGALTTWLLAQGHRWCKGVRVVVSDGSKSYRSSIRQHLGHATHVLDRFGVARWFAAGMIEVRRRLQRIGPKGSRPAFEPAIFGSRYLQLSRFDRLGDDRVEALGKVLSARPELEAAWRMLQHLYRRLPCGNRRGSQPGARRLHRPLPGPSAARVRETMRNAPRVERRDLRLPHLRPGIQRPHRRHQQQTRRPQQGRLRIHQHQQLRRQSPPPHTRHAMITPPSTKELTPTQRAEPVCSGVRHWIHGTTPVASQEAPMAKKDKGGKSSRKVAEKTLKEKRLAKKAKKAPHTKQSLDNTFGR